MIVLPGGGYAAHAPHEAEPVASWLGEIGVQASVFRYPLNVRHPAPLDALRAEIRRRRADGAQRIGLIGFSAGGHLAGLAALAPGAAADQTVQFAVLGYAITSMETETYRPARLILLGEDASPQLRRSTSLDALVTPESPPFFVWHTAEDPYVPPEHTYRFAAALAASRVPHAVHVFAHGPHSLGLAQDADEAAIWTTLANAWIHEQAPPPGCSSKAAADTVLSGRVRFDDEGRLVEEYVRTDYRSFLRHRSGKMNRPGSVMQVILQ
jgi:acetyl esterase/lipase